MPEMSNGLSLWWPLPSPICAPFPSSEREKAAKNAKPNQKQVAKLLNECNKLDLYLQYTLEKLTLSNH